ncbi:MAG: hypothetical protein JWP82_1207 [Humibacillus sp.]|nr:hypothetical protein [Humibacillus sp.]
MVRPGPRAAGMTLVVPVLVGVLAGALGGCAAPDETAYCDALSAASSQWAQAGASLQDKEAATRFVATVKSLEATAPDEVRSQWVALQSLFETFATDHPDLSGVTGEMKTFEESAKRIEAHAKETCGIDLGA